MESSQQVNFNAMESSQQLNFNTMESSQQVLSGEESDIELCYYIFRDVIDDEKYFAEEETRKFLQLHPITTANLSFEAHKRSYADLFPKSEMMKRDRTCSFLSLKRSNTVWFGNNLTLVAFPTRCSIETFFPKYVSCLLRNGACKASIVLRDSEMKAVFNFLNMSRAEFVTRPLPYERIIRDGDPNVIKVVMSQDTAGFKSVDIRVFHQNDGDLVSTRYGITIRGYGELENFLCKEHEVLTAFDQTLAFMSMCGSLTRDLGDRYIQLSNLKQDTLDTHDALRRSLGTFLFEYAPLYMKSMFMTKLCQEHDLDEYYDIVDVLEGLYDNISKYVSGPQRHLREGLEIGTPRNVKDFDLWCDENVAVYGRQKPIFFSNRKPLIVAADESTKKLGGFEHWTGPI